MTKHQRSSQDGMALVFAMMAIIVILGSLGLILSRVHAAKQETDHAYTSIVLEEAAQAGVDLAVKQLWNDYLISNGNTTGNVASYKYFLNNTLNVPINEDLNFNGEKDPGETGNGDSVFDEYPEGYDHRGMPLLDEPIALRDPESNRVMATLDSIYLSRYDSVYASDITVRATASSPDGAQKTAVQMLKIGGAALPHGQFAILANNISCILCHAEVKSLNLELNADPENFGTFDRVKVASLESLMVRPTEADSRLAGTLYTRGQVYNSSGSLLSASAIASSAFKGYAFSNENGKISQSGSGGMSQTSLVNASTNPDGELNQFSNLYMDYPLDQDAQTDGTVPNDFPAPFPDENENRIVDPEEFDVIYNTANGAIDFEHAGETPPVGSISAGIAYGVPQGSVYAGTGLPAVSTGDALASLSTSGNYDGNLILVGTEDDPIFIQNTVAVDGDVIIAGPIKGDGRLMARGNVYIAGDVTYADEPGMFGQYYDAESDSFKDNAFALVAGGSIMMGDYLTVRGVNHSAKNNDKYPNWQQYSIHARDANRTNSVTISGKKETLKWGYFDPWSADPGGVVAGKPGQQFSFTQSELQLFNNMELEKAIADSGYTPRFYGLREGQPNNIYLYQAGDEHSVRYSESGVKVLSDWVVSQGLDPGILDRAVYHYLNPEGNWISEDSLRHIWFDDELQRDRGDEYRFDGLIYSNNSVFTIVRSYTRHYSNTEGRMTIRGGVVAADLGIFVPGSGSGRGLNLFYDPRVERFLDPRNTTTVVFNRMAFFFEQPVAEVEA